MVIERGYRKQDFDLWLRMSRAGIRLLVVSKGVVVEAITQAFQTGKIVIQILLLQVHILSLKGAFTEAYSVVMQSVDNSIECRNIFCQHLKLNTLAIGVVAYGASTMYRFFWSE